MCNQSQAGMGQYGSSSGYRPTGMNTTAYQSNPMPTNNNPTLRNAQQFGQFRMGQMPTFPPRNAPPNVPIPQAPWNPNNGGPMAPPGYGGGYTQPDGTQVLPSPGPQAPSAAPDYAPAISSPASVFGFGTKPAAMPDYAPSQPAQQTSAPAQNALVAQSNANLFSNPWGFSQQQLGPSFNPMGSAQGGYFQGNQYVPNVGNARNGLDELARWGVNWNGVQNGRPGVY